MKLRLCTPLAFSLLVGCATAGPVPGMVGLKPDGSPGPEPCPKKALETMAILRLHPGDGAWMIVDLNQKAMKDIIVNDGPIESALDEHLGNSILDAGTRLYGKVWTSGPDVVIRYYEAHPLDAGGPLAICAVARTGTKLKKKDG